MLSAVSACASKCSSPTFPQPYLLATAVAAGWVIEWSPPMITGKAPARSTSVTLSSMLRCERGAWPCGQ